jgi:cytochrome P450
VPRSIDLRSLFSVGWIRSMQGDTHRHYRRLFIQAFQAVPMSAHEIEFRRVILEQLTILACTRHPTHHQVREVLRTTTSTVMLRFLFGVAPASKEFDDLAAHYRRFGPQAPADRINAQNRDVFADIKQRVNRLAQALKIESAKDASPSVLAHLIDSGSDDDDALGNLIYMFEPAHFDLYSLWHWVLYYVAKNTHVAGRIAEALDDNRVEAKNLMRATALETLRLAQSEVLYREAKSDVIFDGRFFPAGGIVRVCLWEGHKDERAFPDAFSFRPDRFLERQFDIDQFAPFGLDKHRCIGAELTLALTVVFLDELLRNFTCTLIDGGSAQLGVYHWEPNVDSEISLSPRPARPAADH